MVKQTAVKIRSSQPLFPGDVFQIRESVRRDLRRLRGRSDPDGSARAGKPAEERQGCQCEPTGTINSCLRRRRAIEGRFYRMKVMFVNGSSHLRGTTMAAIEEMEKVFGAEGLKRRSFRSAVSRSRIACSAMSVERPENVCLRMTV